jgi:subtilisin family serine protease
MQLVTSAVDGHRPRRRVTAALCAAVALLLLVGVLPTQAHAGPSQAPGGAAVPAEARAQAADEGLVPVIVTLAEPTRPEGGLDVARVRTQRARIGAAQARVAEALPSDGSTVTRDYRTLAATAATVTPAGLDALAASPEVTSIEVDRLYGVASSSDASSTDAPSLNESAEHIGAGVLHDLGVRGAGTAVAILDTGVDADHPAFGSRVVAEACFSRGDDWDPSSGGDCPDGTSEQVGPGAGAPLPDEVADWWHGTHVAGIAAGQAVDADDLDVDHDLRDGVAPEADILAVQVFHANGDGSFAWHSDIIAGLDWVAAQDDHDVAAVNLSLGGDRHTSPCESSSYEGAVGNLASRRIPVVAAAGNEGWQDAIGSPACLPGVISVGSSELDGTVSYYSNAAEFLDLLAPGSWIWAAKPDASADYGSGTSMATPQVAGGLALLRQATGTSLEVPLLLEVLRDTGVGILDDRGGVEDPLEFPEVRLDEAQLSLLGGTVTGTVRDRDTHEGIADATVELQPAVLDSPLVGEASITDADGSYGFDLVLGGDYTVTISAPDYESAERSLTVAVGESVTLDVDLDRSPEVPGKPSVTAKATTSQVSLTWSPGDGGPVDTYVLERDGTQIWSGDATSHVDGDVTPGAEHVYRLRASGPGGTSAAATVVVTVPEPEPEPEPEPDSEPEPAPVPMVRFSDVDPDGAHGAAIGRMAGAGIINGYDDGTFRPTQTLTRAQAASLLVRGLEIDVPQPTGRFRDVPTGYAHAATIEAAAAAGIATGYDDGTFRPGEPLTRAQAATMIARAFGLPAGGSHGFSDVGPAHPHGAGIAAAAAAGAVGGYDDGTFRPTRPLTRAQAASILDRLLHP